MRILIAIIITIFTAAAIFIMGKRDKKIPGKVAICIIGLEILGCIISLAGGSGEAVVKRIRRPAAGEKTDERELTARSGRDKENVTVKISDRELTEKEAGKWLENAEREVKKGYLGENGDSSRVYRDLCLKSRYCGVVKAEWEITPDGIFDSSGEIKNNAVKKPTKVTVKCLLSYRDQSRVVNLICTAVPVPADADIGFDYYLDEALARVDTEEPESEFVTLPDQVNGKEVVFSEKREDDGLKLTILMAVALGLYVFYVRYTKKDRQKKRQREISLDYPRIVSQLSMYIGAGFSVKAAFVQVGNAYIVSRNRGHPESVAFEEVLRMNRRIRDGEDEEGAYRRLGDTLMDKGFRKLTLLLSQSIRKGNRELRDMLEREEKEAYDRRRTDARVAGEEASLKLLIPMMGLLGVIFIVLVVPAFMQIN